MGARQATVNLVSTLQNTNVTLYFYGDYLWLTGKLLVCYVLTESFTPFKGSTFQFGGGTKVGGKYAD